MAKKYKLVFASFLIFISMINPGCKHGSNEGLKLHSRHTIKAVVIKVKPSLRSIKMIEVQHYQ